jgi:hypothetical protein
MKLERRNIDADIAFSTRYETVFGHPLFSFKENLHEERKMVCTLDGAGAGHLSVRRAGRSWRRARAG